MKKNRYKEYVTINIVKNKYAQTLMPFFLKIGFQLSCSCSFVASGTTMAAKLNF